MKNCLLATLLAILPTVLLSAGGCCSYNWPGLYNYTPPTPYPYDDTVIVSPSSLGPPAYPPVVATLSENHRHVLAIHAPGILRRIDYKEHLLLDDIYQMLVLKIPVPIVRDQIVRTETFVSINQQDANQLKLWGFPKNLIDFIKVRPY